MDPPKPSIDEFRAFLGSRKIIGHRVYRPHAVNARVTSSLYTLEINIEGALDIGGQPTIDSYRIPGFESARAAETRWHNYAALFLQ